MPSGHRAQLAVVVVSIVFGGGGWPQDLWLLQLVEGRDPDAGRREAIGLGRRLAFWGFDGVGGDDLKTAMRGCRCRCTVGAAECGLFGW